MLNKNNFAIAKLASKESYGGLTNLRVEQDRTVASDGKLLIVMTGDGVPESDYPSVPGFNPPTKIKQDAISLSRDTALAIAKAIPKTKIPALNHAVVGTNGDGDPAIATTDTCASQVFKAINNGGQFPNWEQVIPAKSEAKVVIAFDPRLMIALLQSMDSVYENGGDHYVKLWLSDEYSAMLLECEHDGQKATGVLMPGKIRE